MPIAETTTSAASARRFGVVKDKLDYLHRRIRAKKSPHAVVRTSRGRFDLLPIESVRLEALLRTPASALRVVGVFTPDVPYSTLCAAVLA